MEIAGNLVVALDLEYFQGWVKRLVLPTMVDGVTIRAYSPVPVSDQCIQPFPLAATIVRYRTTRMSHIFAFTTNGWLFEACEAAPASQRGSDMLNCVRTKDIKVCARKIWLTRPTNGIRVTSCTTSPS
jgi:hypothetical protein